jgi:hypothetical protein
VKARQNVAEGTLCLRDPFALEILPGLVEHHVRKEALRIKFG